MKMFKAFAISFSLYSKIPMPQFKWEDEDMRYSLMFFPFVGMVILGIQYFIYYYGNILSLGNISVSLLMMAVPLIVTGGFHVDGFMDVEDALKSYAPAEKKLEILKDPHIGAFAVIRLATLGLIYLAALCVLTDKGDSSYILIYGIGFVVARALSGIAVISLKPAKKDGMLKKESEVNGHGVLISLIVELVICLAVSFYLNITAALILFAASMIMFFIYRHISYKNFMGITGDTAGYYLVCQETVTVVVLAVCSIL